MFSDAIFGLARANWKALGSRAGQRGIRGVCFEFKGWGNWCLYLDGGDQHASTRLQRAVDSINRFALRQLKRGTCGCPIHSDNRNICDTYTIEHTQRRAATVCAKTKETRHLDVGRQVGRTVEFGTICKNRMWENDAPK